MYKQNLFYVLKAMINFKILPYFQIRHHFNWAHYTVFIWEKVTSYIFSWRTKITSEAVILKVILKVAVSILMTVRAAGMLEGWRNPSYIPNTPLSSETTADASLHGLVSEAFWQCEGAYPEDIKGQAEQFLGKSTWMKMTVGRKEVPLCPSLIQRA